MKIAVSGAHRVGKTSLVESLQESLSDYVSRAEAYCELEEAGFDFSEVPGAEDYIILLEHSIKQVTASENNVIFDRCPIDHLAYMQALDEFKNYNFQALFQRVQDSMAEIDLLVFVPIEEPDSIGCYASDLPGLRRRVNEILKDWIWDFTPDVVVVSGSPSARKDQVLNAILKM